MPPQEEIAQLLEKNILLYQRQRNALSQYQPGPSKPPKKEKLIAKSVKPNAEIL
jgi:hypothetical protein